jgi:hypothetical protein
VSVPLQNLSYVLWRERQLVELARCGTSDRLALHAAELDRAMLVDSVARTLELDEAVTLRQLAARLPEPWAAVFSTHHAALANSDPANLPRSLADFLR